MMEYPPQLLVLVLFVCCMIILYVFRKKAESRSRGGNNVAVNQRRELETDYKFENVLDTGYFGTLSAGSKRLARKVKKKESFLEELTFPEVANHHRIVNFKHYNIISSVKYGPCIVFTPKDTCNQTLEDYFRNGHLITRMQMKQQITEGLGYLHANNIVLGYLNPTSIFVTYSESHGAQCRIANYGIMSKLSAIQHMCVLAINPDDSFIAPEVLQFNEGRKMVKESDMFSLGRVFEYIDQMDQSSDEWLSLKFMMTQVDPLNRPPVDAVLGHPIFWNAKEILNFIQDFANGAPLNPVGSNWEKCFKFLNSCLHILSGQFVEQADGWKSVLCDAIRKESSGEKWKYDSTSVWKLLVFIRNMNNHWKNKNKEPGVKKALGDTTESFWEYFKSRYPVLDEVLFLSLLLVEKSKKLSNPADGCAKVLKYYRNNGSASICERFVSHLKQSTNSNCRSSSSRASKQPETRALSEVGGNGQDGEEWIQIIKLESMGYQTFPSQTSQRLLHIELKEGVQASQSLEALIRRGFNIFRAKSNLDSRGYDLHTYDCYIFEQNSRIQLVEKLRSFRDSCIQNNTTSISVVVTKYPNMCSELELIWEDIITKLFYYMFEEWQVVEP